MKFLKHMVRATLLTALLLTTTTSCEYVKQQLNKIEEEETPAHTDSVTITAYSRQVGLGSHPDFMKDVEAVGDSGKLKVTVDTSQVDMFTDGDYPVTYSATGSDGFVTTKTVRLKVTDPSKRVIYLTFDDGPSSNTERILDILKENDVHATFFVTAQNPGCFRFIKRAYEEGNAIAAHTYSHNFAIYRSIDAYFADLDKIQDVIEQYTGQRTQIIRFPGGSSNNMFHRYNSDPEFMVKLCKEVLNRGYQYVDWNSDSRDASVNFPTMGLVANSSCRMRAHELCLLMHDTRAKNGTVAALPEVIKYFKDNGYEFRTINSTGYICHHTLRVAKPVQLVKAPAKTLADSTVKTSVKPVVTPTTSPATKPAAKPVAKPVTVPENKTATKSETEPKLKPVTDHQRKDSM